MGCLSPLERDVFPKVTKQEKKQKNINIKKGPQRKDGMRQHREYLGGKDMRKLAAQAVIL